MDLILEIMFIIAIIVCCVLNAVVACVWLNGIYRNPEATKFSIVPVIISCGTSELAISVLIFRVMVRHIF